MGEPAFRRNATIVEEHLRSGSPCNRTQQVVRVAVRAPNLPGFVVLVMCNFAVRKYEIKKMMQRVGVLALCEDSDSADGIETLIEFVEKRQG